MKKTVIIISAVFLIAGTLFMSVEPVKGNKAQALNNECCEPTDNCVCVPTDDGCVCLPLGATQDSEEKTACPSTLDCICE